MKVFFKALGMLLGRRPPSLQVAALCVDAETGKVLLITSRGTGRWVIPKGWPMPGKSLPGAAATEAWEEAGAQGVVATEEIGRYRYDKDQNRGFSVPVEVHVFVLQVSQLVKDFPEAAERERRWFDPAEAATLVREEGLQGILLSMARRSKTSSSKGGTILSSTTRQRAV